MNAAAGLSLAMTSLIGIPAFAAELGCSHYVAFNKLPDNFREIASGNLGGVESFVLSNGDCTCDNGPAILRRFGRPAPVGVIWSCRIATADEREVKQ